MRVYFQCPGDDF